MVKQDFELTFKPTKRHAQKSLVIAFLIIIAWFSNLYISLTLNSENIIFIVLQAWIQSLLFVGIFVTAHDSMHGLIKPYSHKLNHLIGKICCFLFAGFSYQKLKLNHLQHHKTPAQKDDPDYTNKKHEGFWGWLGSFMSHYFSFKEFLILHLHVGAVYFIGGMEFWKVFVFFAIPSWVASLQLFYFGTYLPHRNFKKLSPNIHNSRSNNFNTFISFITCFHFGYHYEHHAYPYLAWWRLPEAYKAHQRFK